MGTFFSRILSYLSSFFSTPWGWIVSAFGFISALVARYFGDLIGNVVDWTLSKVSFPSFPLANSVFQFYAVDILALDILLSGIATVFAAWFTSRIARLVSVPIKILLDLL